MYHLHWHGEGKIPWGSGIINILECQGSEEQSIIVIIITLCSCNYLLYYISNNQLVLISHLWVRWLLTLAIGCYCIKSTRVIKKYREYKTTQHLPHFYKLAVLYQC